jgi:hypothetical protein
MFIDCDLSGYCPLRIATLALDAFYIYSRPREYITRYKDLQRECGVVVGEWDSQFMRFAKERWMHEYARTDEFDVSIVPSTLHMYIPEELRPPVAPIPYSELL